MVRRLRFVNATGGVVEASTTRNRHVFRAAAVSLGALGVVTEVTLQCVPHYRLRVRQRPVPDKDILQNWERHMRSGEFVKVRAVPALRRPRRGCGKGATMQSYPPPPPPPSSGGFRTPATPPCFPRTALTCRRTLTQCRGPSASPSAAPWVDCTRAQTAAPTAAAQRRDGPLPPCRSLSSWVPFLTTPFNMLLGVTGFRERERIARWDQGLIIPFPVPPHAELEYSVPLHKGLDFFISIMRTARARGWRLNQVVEVRFVAGDDLWLSTDFGGPRCHITILLPSERGREEIRSVFAAVEEAALPMGGRPHWAKSFYAPHPAIARMFPHWRDWHRVRCRMDPDGMFSNEYLDAFIGTAEDSCQA